MAAKIVCPYCGVFTAPIPYEFNAMVFKKYTGGRVDQDNGVAYATTPEGKFPRYGIMVCQSCSERIIVEILRWTDTWKTVYPILTRPVSEYIPEPIRSEFVEANKCFVIGAYRASIVMSATSLEGLYHDKKVSGLKDLRDKGIISPALFDQANEIRLWGNIVKHELIHEVVDPGDAEQLLAWLELVLDAIYVHPARLAELSKKRKNLANSVEDDKSD